MISFRQGDALTELQKLEPESVDCCITSPPYWALRDYKCNGQLGLEPTFQEYINKLVTIFDEVKRVLKRSGSCWVVIGDTYTATKSLAMIPERFSIAMIDHGWILRNKIIWYKPNCMPSSAKDRFTVDWEYVYFFTKSQRYFFETQYEPMLDPEDCTRRWTKKMNYTLKQPSTDRSQKTQPNSQTTWTGSKAESGYVNPLGRIKRCVWKISTTPFSGAHFAVFAPKLVEPMIRAGCPEYICNKCQEPRKLQYEETRLATRPGFDVGNGKSGHIDDPNRSLHGSDLSKYRQQIMRYPKIGGNKAADYGPRTYSGNEWNPSLKADNGQMTDCGCNAGFHSSVVIDPFMGSGTVGLVAAQNARDFIGIELNPEYVELAKKRLEPFIGQERLIVARA